MQLRRRPAALSPSRTGLRSRLHACRAQLQRLREYVCEERSSGRGQHRGRRPRAARAASRGRRRRCAPARPGRAPSPKRLRQMAADGSSMCAAHPLTGGVSPIAQQGYPRLTRESAGVTPGVRYTRGPPQLVQPMTTSPDLVLVDGSSYLYRAFHALPPPDQLAGRAHRRRARRAQHAAEVRQGLSAAAHRGGVRCAGQDLPRRAVRRVQGAPPAHARRSARADRAAAERSSGHRACRCCAWRASRRTTSSARWPAAPRRPASRC